MCDCLVFYVVILDNFVVVEFYGIDMFFFFFFLKVIFTVSNFNACRPLFEFHRELSLLEKSCKEQLWYC